VNNPFRFGEPVTGEFFISRDNEISEIVANAKSHKNTTVYGERHVGKSSLLEETARRNAKEFIFVIVDVCAVADVNQFLDCFTREVIKAGVGRAWRIEPALWDLLSTRRMRLALSRGGDLAIEDKIRANMPREIAAERADADSSEATEERKPSIQMCPRCHRPLKWIETYKRHFCYSCKRYAPKQRKRPRGRGRESGSSSQTDLCPNCMSSMRYVHRYSDYYCPTCRLYPSTDRCIVSEPWARGDMTAALDLPQKLSELKDKPVVMMLDDFQDVEDLEDGRVVDAMRQRFEEHEDATYVFAGNGGGTMWSMFEDGDGVLYKFAKSVDLGRIPDPEMQRFLVSRFRSRGGKLSESMAERIAGVSEGIPAYAQQIGHELFHISTAPERSDVEIAIQNTVAKHSRVYAVLLESIRSPLHRRYLFAVMREPGVPHGEAFIRRYGLRSRSHVQRIESQLEARGIIKEGEILDPMFVMWLRQSNSL
jgi:hypothetical protein